MVPVDVQGKVVAAPSVLYTLRVIVLKCADRAATSRFKCIPDMAAVAFPVGQPVGLPCTLWTFNLDLRHPLQSKLLSNIKEGAVIVTAPTDFFWDSPRKANPDMAQIEGAASLGSQKKRSDT
jgi:hypothetical protein